MSFGIVLLIVGILALIASIWMTSERGRELPTPSRREHVQSDLSGDFSALIDAIHYEGSANRKEEQREDRGKVFRDCLTIGILALTFVALATTCWAIIKQVDVMAGQLTSMNGQQSTLQGQLDEMKADRRPWVAFDNNMVTSGALIFDEDGAHVNIAAILRNGGKSIARNINSLVSKLNIEPLFPDNMQMSPEQITRFAMRGLFGSDPCGPMVARGFTAIGGSLLLPEGTQRYLPSGSGRFDIPKNDFRTNSIGEVGAWMNICIFYQDDAGAVHATPSILLFINDADGRDHFLPVGEIHGSFQVFSGGASAY